METHSQEKIKSPPKAYYLFHTKIAIYLSDKFIMASRVLELLMAEHLLVVVLCCVSLSLSLLSPSLSLTLKCFTHSTAINR